MTLELIQTCNGCGTRRQLPLYGSSQPEREGGWREVSNAKHLCAKCIKKALERGQSDGD